MPSDFADPRARRRRAIVLVASLLFMLIGTGSIVDNVVDGDLVLGAGAIDPHQLADALRAQVQARFDRVFDDPHVAYAFRASREDAGAYRLDVDARQMVFESARRSDERSDLRG